MRRWFSIIGLLVIAACAHAGLEPKVVESFPEDVRASYGTFEHKCSRCHPLSRALNAEIYDPALWSGYVARMRHHAGSGISESDASAVVVFLKYYAEHKKER